MRTTESVNQKLLEDSRGITMISPYVSAKSHATFRCDNGHEWITDANHILNHKSGCPTCHLEKQRFTKEKINKFFEESGSGIIISGAFTKTNEPTTLQCSHGHEWVSYCTNILSKNKIPVCPECNGKKKRLRRLNKDIINERLRAIDSEIMLIGNYLNCCTKTLFRCSMGHEWESLPNNVIRGSGCPTCTPGGFNVMLPGSVYVIVFDAFIKYGISNRVQRRLTEHQKHGDYYILKILNFSTGKEAADMENKIRETFGGNYIDPSIMPVGHTETISLSMLSEITTFINECETSK